MSSMRQAPPSPYPLPPRVGGEGVKGGHVRSDVPNARPVRVAAFTAGEHVPAARFRVRQYRTVLAGQGVELREYWPRLGAYPPASRLLRPAWLVGTLAERIPHLIADIGSDVALVQREFVSTLPTIEGLTRRPRIVDIDDAIHLVRGGRAARHLARLADLVIVGNRYLAEAWRHLTAAVVVMPTAVDTARYMPSPLPEKPVLGWIGTAGNLRYLHRIAPALEAAVRRFPDTQIAVCSDAPPDLGRLPVRYVPWSEQVEASFLASISVGLMPLDDGEWERGKCSFKMLQYMAAGRPCIVSPVGMNRDILAEAEIGRAATSPAEWVEALCGLLADRNEAERLGAAGRELAVSGYSVAAMAPRLAGLLRRAASGNIAAGSGGMR